MRTIRRGRASMKLQPIVTNVQTGVLSALLEVLGVASFAALIFSGPLAGHLATGLVLLLISTTILGLVGTLGSSYPGMLVSLRTPMIPVLAAMVAAVAATMTAQGREADLLGTAIATLGVTSIVSGLASGAARTIQSGQTGALLPLPGHGRVLCRDRGPIFSPAGFRSPRTSRSHGSTSRRGSLPRPCRSGVRRWGSA